MVSLYYFKVRKCNPNLSLLPCKKVFKIFTIYKIEVTPDKHNYYSNVPDYAKFRPSDFLYLSLNIDTAQMTCRCTKSIVKTNACTAICVLTNYTYITQFVYKYLEYYVTAGRMSKGNF